MAAQPTSAEVILEPCDVFFTQGSSFVSRAIRFFTRGAGESRTKVNRLIEQAVGLNPFTRD